MSYSIPLIHKAIYDPKLDLNRIRALISADCSHTAAVNRQNGYSPLHAAARRGDPALTKLLIDSGCFVDARTTIGQTPFLIACQVHLLCRSDSNILVIFGDKQEPTETLLLQENLVFSLSVVL